MAARGAAPRPAARALRPLRWGLAAAAAAAALAAAGAPAAFASAAAATRAARGPGRPLQATPLQLPSWFPWPLAPPSLPTAVAAELRTLLLAAAAKGEDPDLEKAEPLVRRLAAARVPFRAELLGLAGAPSAGLWRSAYIAGERPIWARNAKLLPFLRNKAGQAYDVGTGRVTNYGEIAGGALYFTAEGSFEPVDDSQNCPKDFTVAIERGGPVVLGLPLLSDAISGPGYVRVLYLDEDIRVFESPETSPGRWESSGLIVVQVRDALFER